MFLKPYRTLLLDNSIKSHEAWLDKDIASVPTYIMTSLLEHVDNIKSDSVRYHVAPVLKQVLSQKNRLIFRLKYLAWLTLCCEIWLLGKPLLNHF